jgi:hypothetical protein
MEVRERGIKYMNEPECWVGPNSILAEPEPFPDIPEDHFQLRPEESQELQKMIDEKCQTDFMGYNAKNKFALQSPSKDFNKKQQELSASLDKGLHDIYSDQEKLRKDVEPLWKLNNIMVYDLSDVDYDHAAAMESLNQINARLDKAGFKPKDVEELEKSDARLKFVSKKMKTENIGEKKKVQKESLLSFDDYS